VRALFGAYFATVWRTACRLGLSDAAAEDVAQEVFVVAAERLGDIAEGKERAFLIGTAVRVAANARRVASRRPDAAGAVDVGALGETAADPAPGPEELLDRRRARALLDRALDALEDDLRVVLVLTELDAMSAPEIAAALEIPVGTVASRLRRAREEFGRNVRRLRARAAPAEARSTAS